MGAVTVAMKEAAELIPVQRIVGGVRIQNDAFGWQEMLLRKRVYQETLHGIQVSDELLVAAVGVATRRCHSQAIERALASQCFASVVLVQVFFAFKVLLADEYGQERMAAQLVVIDQVFVTEAETKEALLKKFRQGVLD